MNRSYIHLEYAFARTISLSESGDIRRQTRIFRLWLFFQR